MRHWVTMTEIFHSFWSRQQFDKRSSDLISETHSRRWKLWPPLTPSSLISETYYKIPGPRMHLIFFKGDQAQNDLGFMVDQAKWVCKIGYLLSRKMWKKIFTLQKQPSFGLHVVWKSPKMSRLILAFSTFCPIKIDCLTASIMFSKSRQNGPFLAFKMNFCPLKM